MNQSKSKVFGIVVLLALCIGLSLRAQAHVYEYQVLRPDGKPAVGAKVRALFGFERSVQLARNTGKERDVRMQTDAQGKFKVESQQEKEGLLFVIVDAPGCNLAFWNDLPANGTPLRLSAEQPLTGIVTREENTPVVGATVVAAIIGLATYGAVFLQDPRDVQFPEATATSGADGIFRLRGMRLNEYKFDTGTCLWAITKINDQNWMGWMLRPNKEDSRAIKIAPNVSIHGSVVHYATGQPLAGARVGYSGSGLKWEPVVTDAEGHFRFDDLPRDSTRHLTITYPDFPDAIMHIFNGREVMTDKQLKSELIVGLRPLVKITGKVMDEATRQPLPFSMDLSAEWMQKSSGWTFSVSAGSSTDAQTGTFTFAAPVGALRLIASPGLMDVDSNILEAIDRPLEVPVGGIENLSVPARKQPGLWIKFVKTNDADGWPGFIIQKRTPEGWQYLASSPGYSWFNRAEKWGDTVEIRGIVDMNSQKEIFPPTRLVADPDKWPTVIMLPAISK